jgi:hypothetical protein
LAPEQQAVLTEMGTLIRKMLCVPRRQSTFTSTTTARMSVNESSNLMQPVVYSSGNNNNNTETINALSTENDVSKERLLFQLQCFRESVDQLAGNILVPKKSSCWK